MPSLSRKSVDFENFSLNQNRIKNILSFEVLQRQDDPTSRLKFIQSVFYWFDHWQGWQQRYLITKIIESLPPNKLIFLKSAFQWVNNKGLSNNNDIFSNDKIYKNKEDTKLEKTSSKSYNNGLINVKKTHFSNYERARWLLNHYIALLQREYTIGSIDINDVNKVENDLKVPSDSEYVPSFSLPLVEEVEKEVKKLTLDKFVNKLCECKAKKKQ